MKKIFRRTILKNIIVLLIGLFSFKYIKIIQAMEKDSNICINEIRVDGGMINNNNFLQSLSNVTQVKIIKPKNIETTSLGKSCVTKFFNFISFTVLIIPVFHPFLGS